MSDNYWEKRAVDLEKLTQDRADVDIMHVNKLFDGAVDIVEKQIEEIFGKYARDSGISQDAALRLLNEKQTETMRRNLMITLAQCQEEIARQAILARIPTPENSCSSQNIAPPTIQTATPPTISRTNKASMITDKGFMTISFFEC